MMTAAVIANDVHSLQHKLADAICTFDYDIESRERCVTNIRATRLGSIDVFRYHGCGLRRVSRSFRSIRDDGVDDFLISLPLNLPIRIRQANWDVVVEPGTFMFLSTGRLFEKTTLVSPSRPVQEQQIFVRVSAPLLRRQISNVDDYCGCPIRIAPGAAKIMTSLFDLALSEGGALSESQARGFREMLTIGIVNAILNAPELERWKVGSTESAHEVLRARALEYAEQNLSNPALDIDDIAVHCHVSVRYLHAAFANSSTTLGALIRNMRLDGCRAALRSSAMRRRSILEIALHWGFTNSASFSRAYRSRFGTTPREDRLAAMT